METTNFEKMIINSQGITGIKNRIVNNSIMYAARKVKTHFGIDMKFNTVNEIKGAINWIQKYDKKFRSHISNPYSQGSIINKEPVIEGMFIIKLDKATYAFVSGDVEGSPDNNSRRNTISMYIFGKKTMKYFRELKCIIDKETSSSSMMYSITANGDGNRSYWTCSGTPLTPRPMDTLFFDSGIKDRIINHLNTWLSNEDIYKKRGLIYKTGILLYGTKGTGKSSLASAIANYLKCGLIVIDCTTFDKLNIAEVSESINADETRYVVLLDEIDSIFGNRDDDIDDDKNKRISKLLSFLDSPSSPTNVVFVATTNYIDRLDKAAIRKGRFDIKEELTDIHKEAAIEMCKGFDLPQDKIDKIINNSTFPINPSDLQGVILESIRDSSEGDDVIEKC